MLNLHQYRKKFAGNYSPLDRWNKFGKDIIPLWVADMDFTVCDDITQAINQENNIGKYGYCSPPTDLYETIINYIYERYDWEISRSQIILIPNVMTGMYNCVQEFTEVNDYVVTPQPIYYPFYDVVEKQDREVAPIKYEIKNSRLLPDYSSITQEHQTAKLFLFCNPQNPGGTMFNYHELTEIADLVIKNNWILCSDEIHADINLTKHTKHIPIAKLSDKIAERTITLLSPSKAYNIPSIGFAYAIITNEELRDRFKKSIQPWVNLNPLSIVAVKTALSKCENWLNKTIEKIRINYITVLDWAKKQAEVSVIVESEATFMVWIGIKNGTNINLNQLFLRHGVAVVDGIIYRQPGFIRLNIATSTEVLREALFRMEGALKTIE